MTTNFVYLITGANKGIGRAILTRLLTRPRTTVVAAVRNPTDPTAASLSSLPHPASTRLLVLGLREPADFASLASALAAEGIAYIDVAIANAGHTSGFKPLLSTTPEDALYDFEVNAVGPLRLLQAVAPLLLGEEGVGGEGSNEKGPKKFVYITSSVGSIAGLETESFPSAAYGMSKAAGNWLAKKASVELKEKGLAVGVLHPGWVKTDMGQVLADSIGVKEPPVTVEESATKCLGFIDDLTIENTGRFINVIAGEELPW